MDLTTVYDCTGANIGSFTVPPGVLLAGYVTGADEVPWTPAQFSRFPGAIRIDQSPVNTPADELADVIDMENKAATLDDLTGWVHAARTSYALATRPGQREPCIYCSRPNVTPAVNQLIAGGITSGVYLWVAEQMKAKDAASELDQAGGPFPIIGVQYEFHTTHDISLFSTAWLNHISGKPPVPKPAPGTQTGWRYCSKCKGLFYGPQQQQSMCPRGGIHDGSHSHSYTLGFDL
jgi:hypothetical protein